MTKYTGGWAAEVVCKHTTIHLRNLSIFGPWHLPHSSWNQSLIDTEGWVYLKSLLPCLSFNQFFKISNKVLLYINIYPLYYVTQITTSLWDYTFYSVKTCICLLMIFSLNSILICTLLYHCFCHLPYHSYICQAYPHLLLCFQFFLCQFVLSLRFIKSIPRNEG